MERDRWKGRDGVRWRWSEMESEGGRIGRTEGGGIEEKGRASGRH